MAWPHPAPAWGRLVLIALPPLVAVAALAAALLFGPASAAAEAPAPDAAPAPPMAAPATPGLLVHVSGAVVHPGLYRMTRGERVYAAIAAAGGITADADPDRMPDLAGVLRDGQQVKVPVLKGSAGRSATARVDLNSAAEEQLAAVPGFTPDLAAEAVRYRANFGGFQKTSELVTAVGMDAAAFALAKKYVRV